MRLIDDLVDWLDTDDGWIFTVAFQLIIISIQLYVCGMGGA